MKRQVGLWLIGAYGGVGTTVVVGLAAWSRRLADATGLVTALPLFDGCDLDPADSFVIGGHELRRGSFQESASALKLQANLFSAELLDACRPELDRASSWVRPGSNLHAGQCIQSMADWPEAREPQSCRRMIERIQHDWSEFRAGNGLDQMVVVNVASTEPRCPHALAHDSPADFEAAIDRSDASALPSSCLYAYAAIDEGYPYVNFTPSLGASPLALQELALKRGCPIAGQDGKTGETLVKSVLAPLFPARNWKVLSWLGQNLIGNRDGWVLDDPANKESKLRSKDQVVGSVLGYQPRTQVGIEYVPSLDDWKTAWDFIHFQGFLGVKMSLQFTWQGCDSILAAPLVIDLARLMLLAQRRGEAGVLPHLASFFKSPLGVNEHNFAKQFQMLEDYAWRASSPPGLKVAAR